MTATCIYCRQSEPAVVFNREHVLPEAFGRFKGALTLHDTVCKPCNSFFADSMDKELSRNAAEGLERYKWGIKKPEEIKNFRFDNVKLRTHEAGDFKGVRAELYHDVKEGKILAKPLAGAAIRNAEGEDFTYFTLDEILDGSWKNRLEGTDWKRGIKIVTPDDALMEVIRAKLQEGGVDPTVFRPLEPPGSQDIEFEQEFVLTPIIKRGLAKIALNYLAFRQGPAFVLSPHFDPIRRYVRYGEDPPLPPIHSTWELPFAIPSEWKQQPVVHWIAITGYEAHRNLLGEVMLFSFMTHIVVLAQDFPGPWPELPMAHLYNPKPLTVEEQIPRKRWKHPDTSV